VAAAQGAEVPVRERSVVAGVPPGTVRDGSEACGVGVAGAITQGSPAEWRAVVLEDASVEAASPTVWATAAIDAYTRWGADRLVAEVNQGGEMVETIVRSIDPLVPYRAVHASRGKAARAEPVAGLYEQGRVCHSRGLGALEDQMCRMTRHGYDGQGSPDRVNALVWALHDLMIGPAKGYSAPQIRPLR